MFVGCGLHKTHQVYSIVQKYFNVVTVNPAGWSCPPVVLSITEGSAKKSRGDPYGILRHLYREILFRVLTQKTQNQFKICNGKAIFIVD